MRNYFCRQWAAEGRVCGVWLMKENLEGKNILDQSELNSRLFDGFADASARRYIFVCNMETNVSRWSKAAVEEFGLPGEYMKHAGTIWGEHIHPEDREAYLKDIEAVFAGKKNSHEIDYRVRNRKGEYVICTGVGHVIKGTEGQPNLFIGSIENHGIVDNVDAATHLYNVYKFWSVFHELRDREQKPTVLLFGINHFSDINDSYGYDFGNKVLYAFGQKMRDAVKELGSLYRSGGARFICLLPDCDRGKVESLYKKMQYLAKHDIYVDDMRISLNISGGAFLCDEACDKDTTQTSARYAFMQSKHKYHSELVFFEHELPNSNKKNLEFMRIIRESIMNDFDGFYLCYQPIVDAKIERLIGAEALLRWNKEPYGEVPPGVFIPWLENDPSFMELGNWILRQALTEGKPIIEKYPDFVLNVNVAYSQMSHTDFGRIVEQILKETGFPPQNLCLELTERCRQLEKGYLQSVVTYLKELGIKIAVDDFGTGFSSLNLLSEIPVDTLKIDRGFVWDIETNRANQAIVKAVTGCAEDLDVHVCLEGLENREMIDFVKQYAVYSYQGYYFSRPIPMKTFVERYC